MLGPLVVAGAGYMLLYFGWLLAAGCWLLDRAAALRALSATVSNPPLASALLQALLIGVVYWARPSLLRGLETQSNQWVSSRKATKVIDITHEQVDLFVEQHARRVGWLLLAASVYLFVVMFRWLL